MNRKVSGPPPRMRAFALSRQRRSIGAVSDFAAVPSNEHQPYLDVQPVTDDEFEAWVKRSQADTDAVLAEWDDSVEFHQVESIEASEAAADEPPADATDERPGMFDELAGMFGAGRPFEDMPFVPAWEPVPFRNRVPLADPQFQLRVSLHTSDPAPDAGSVTVGIDEARPSMERDAFINRAALTLYDTLDWDYRQCRQRMEEQGFVVLERSREPFGNAMNFWLPPPDPTMEAVRREYGL